MGGDKLVVVRAGSWNEEREVMSGKKTVIWEVFYVRRAVVWSYALWMRLKLVLWRTGSSEVRPRQDVPKVLGQLDF